MTTDVQGMMALLKKPPEMVVPCIYHSGQGEL